MAKGKLVLLGSGETAPGMTKVHRELLSGLGEVRAVNLDTPYGFQLNVPQMTQKLVDYFKVSLQTDLKPLSFTNYEKSSGVERELFRQSVREANYVFAGPGSPSYALAQWKCLDLQEDLLHVIDNGGVVCFSSAAALTLGAFTAPIYEIYKAGAEPHWLEGLNLMGLLGINCAIIPHFNNAEGQDYDTSCCYLGLERLEVLEEVLADDASVLGIEEHTALIINLASQTFSITGKGIAFWRAGGLTEMLLSGKQISLVNLTNKAVHKKVEPENIRLLNIEETSNDQLVVLVEQSKEFSVEALTELYKRVKNARQPDLDLINLIEALINIRFTLKNSGEYGLADQIRDALRTSGIDLIDSFDGTTWQKMTNR